MKDESQAAVSLDHRMPPYRLGTNTIAWVNTKQHLAPGRVMLARELASRRR